MNNQYTFLLKNQVFEVSADYTFLVKIGEDIGKHLLETKNYMIKSNVQPQNFQEFLTYLTVNNKLTINSSNYHDFYLLNEEFNHLISDILLKPEYSVLQEELILDILILQETKDKSSIEKEIASKLDHYLSKFSEKMSKIPFTSLYNIFNHENRNLNDHEKAYQFIIQNIERNENKENKKSFCILLGSLEAIKLNKKSINDSILKREEHFEFAPKSNDSFICSVNQNIAEMKNQIDTKFEQLFSFLLENQKKIDDRFTSIENKYELLSNKINETMQPINEIQNKIQQISQKIENSDNNNDVNSNLQQIQLKVDSIQTNCQQISQKIEDSNNNNEVNSNLQQLQLKVDSISQKAENTNDRVQFLYRLKNDRFDIIHKLIKDYGEDIIERGIIDVNSSTYYSEECKPSNVILFDNFDKDFASKNVSGSWICFDFKSHQVIPINYTIRTSNKFTFAYYPRHFVFECSNDKENWEILDEQNDCSFLKGNNRIHTFNILNRLSKSFRYVRIRSTGQNWGSQYYLAIGSFDVYGILL